ncbi:hypothetical protein VN97_g9110 [Penicillium thymicola]|uniref:Uncharacterized protein n=1 Tax=Penicillium thymicola TaxID=293382 RepID=A0AAI9X534_PENTH|nr:hypothetical protein VN97_g9110 [Penicillium thymicola]
MRPSAGSPPSATDSKYRSGELDSEVNVGNHGDDKGHDPDGRDFGGFDSEVNVGNHGDDKGHDPDGRDSGGFDSEVNVGNHGDDKDHDPEREDPVNKNKKMDNCWVPGCLRHMALYGTDPLYVVDKSLSPSLLLLSVHPRTDKSYRVVSPISTP